MKKSPQTISVIVTTYNWPQALERVIEALLAQRTDCPFEIMVADDGSTMDTAKKIEQWQVQSGNRNIVHVWQEDEGFRVAAIRNKAIARASGDYILFLDGDCIPGIDFIDRHYRLSEKNVFVTGNRVLLTKLFTQKVLSQSMALHQWSCGDWCRAFFQGSCNRFSPFISFPSWMHIKTRSSWKGAKGCNLGIWKSDLMRVNGWEEQFRGWGYEDSDLVIRLLKAGVRRKNARFYIPVIHLWHVQNDRGSAAQNWDLFKRREQNTPLCAVTGLDQYL